MRNSPLLDLAEVVPLSSVKLSECATLVRASFHLCFFPDSGLYPKALLRLLPFDDRIVDKYYYRIPTVFPVVALVRRKITFAVPLSLLNSPGRVATLRT